MSARFTRRATCPVCGGFDGMRRGAGERCGGFLSDDGRFAHCTRDDGGGRLSAEGAGTFAHFLAGRCRCGATHGDGKRPVVATVLRPVAARQLRSAQEASALWGSLSSRDDAGEAYLRGRKLWPVPNGVAKFNIGRSGDRWLDARAADGYRIAVAMREASGAVRSLALRFCGRGEAPNGRKVLNLANAPSGGMLFALPTFWTGAAASDPVLLCEGATDFLAGVFRTNEMATGRGDGVPWPFGLPGVGTVAAGIDSFASVFCGRRIFLVLDADEAGRKGTSSAASAAHAVGAEPLAYPLPVGMKDLADFHASLEEAA